MQQYQLIEGKPPSPYHGFNAVSQFQLMCLSQSDIPAFLNNQERALVALKVSGKEHHLKMRSLEDLQEHISAPMPIIGIKDSFNEDKLVAQALVSYMRYADIIKNLSGYPIDDTNLATTAIIQSLTTDCDYKGKGLAQTVLTAAKGMAAAAGMVQIIGKVADDNPDSQKSFLKNGFHVAATGMDPVKNYPVSYFVCDLQHRSAASVNLAMAS